jgi:hypothetical protein
MRPRSPRRPPWPGLAALLFRRSDAGGFGLLAGSPEVDVSGMIAVSSFIARL